MAAAEQLSSGHQIMCSLAQRFNSSSSPLWGEGGTVVCSLWNGQDGHMANDGASGVFCTWDDLRDGARIYAQRIDGFGNIVWPINGVTVCSANGAQTSNQLAADGTGAMVVAWIDARMGQTDIYAQRISPDGQAEWDATGLIVSNTSQPKGNLQIAATPSRISLASLAKWYLNDEVFVQSLNLGGDALAGVNRQEWSANSGPRTGPVIAALAWGPVVAWTNSANIVDPSTNTLLHPKGLYLQSTDDYHTTWGLGAAQLQSVHDVARDQGSRVTLRWSPSPYDNTSNEAVTHYSVWRALDSLQAQAGPLDALVDNYDSHSVRAEKTTDGIRYWEWLGDLEALSFEGYEFTASTLMDSIANPAVHEYQVVTHSVDRFTYWKSEPMTGYSVDNLAPTTPQGLASNLILPQSTIKVHWRPNKEADLKGYNVHRDQGADFTPSEENLVASTTDTLVIAQIGFTESPWYIKVSAIDTHDNESGFATLAPIPGGHILSPIWSESR